MLEGHDLGCERRGASGLGVGETLLIHSDRGHPTDTVGVFDDRVGELDHRAVGGGPTHTELRRGSGDRPAVDVDQIGDPGPSPPRQRRPGGYRIAVFGPGVGLTVGIGAAPTAASEAQHRRATSDRQIPPPRCDPDHDPLPGNHRKGTQPDPRWFPPTATTRHQPAPGRRPPDPANQQARSHQRYSESRTRVSPSTESLTCRMARPEVAPV